MPWLLSSRGYGVLIDNDVIWLAGDLGDFDLVGMIDQCLGHVLD